MSLSLYDISVPAFSRGLDVLSHLLDKGVAYADEKGIDHAVLIGGRLAPDMYTLIGQVQAASDAAKFGAARLASIAPPSFADTETTVAQLRTRIANTQDFLRSVTPQSMDGDFEREIVIRPGGRELKFSAQDYIRAFVLPNFYFHITTAYGILRNQGVGLGKMEYLRGA